MGDRANFGFRHGNGHIVFVYGHWAGEGMLNRFANALAVVQAYGRLGDEAYGTRIAFDSLTADSMHDLGWGITVDSLADNDHKIPVFDFVTQRVTLYGGFDMEPTEPIFTLSVGRFIEKYAKLDTEPPY